jgi:membrane protease YdiL (CAAX protease family)
VTPRPDGSLPADSNAAIALLVIGPNLVGLFLLWRLVLSPAARPAAQRLTAWTAPVTDFLLFLLFGILGGLGCGAAAGQILRHFSPLGDDLRLLSAGAALQVGVLIGAAGYYLGIHRRHSAPPISAPLSGPSIWLSGAATFLICLPLINATSLAWQGLLHLLGLPVEKQEMIDLLIYDHSPAVRGLLILLAAVGAPMMEETIFRLGFFRYLRTRVPRWCAFLLPAMLFAAAHANLAAFAPLVVLGLVFSFAFERTGRIGTTMVAHGLFNLNTIALILCGITN